MQQENQKGNLQLNPHSTIGFWERKIGCLVQLQLQKLDYNIVDNPIPAKLLGLTQKNVNRTEEEYKRWAASSNVQTIVFNILKFITQNKWQTFILNYMTLLNSDNPEVISHQIYKRKGPTKLSTKLPAQF